MFECDFISGAANTVRGGTKWFTANDVNYIAYACSNLVLIVNESKNRVICSLKGHTKKVTCVTINQQNNRRNIISDTNRFIEIISAGDDGQIILWHHKLPLSDSINNSNTNEDLIHWEKVIIATMKSPINAIACVSSSSSSSSSTSIDDISSNNSVKYGTMITAADAMGYVHSWLRLKSSSEVESNDDNTSFQLVDEFKTHLSQNAYCLSLDCININDETLNRITTDKTIVLFSGCLDSKIYVRTCSFNTICNKAVTPTLTSEKVEAIVSTASTTTPNSENINVNTIPTTTSLLPPSVTISKAESSSPPYSQSFILRGTLQGHEEWVTCLHTIQLSPNVLMLASGSKDNKIRLWRIESSLIVHSSSTSSIAKLQSETENAADSVIKVEEGEDKKNIIEDDEEDEDEEEHGGGEMLVETEDDEVKNEARLNFKTSCITQNNDNYNSAKSEQNQQQQKFVQHSIFLDALLVGHEGWVTSVHWMLPSQHATVPVSLISNSDSSSSHSNNKIIDNNGAGNNITTTTSSSSSPATSSTTQQQQLQLFSTSMDRNMVIWSTDSFTGAYTPRVRVGDIGGQLGGSVGANLLGFVSGCVSHDNRSLLGVGYGGSLHLWKQQKQQQEKGGVDISASSSSSLEFDGRWMPVPLTTGHFGSVSDCLWGGNSNCNSNSNDSEVGQYLVSVSSDQTCRIFAQCWLPQNSRTENNQKENNRKDDRNNNSNNNYLWKEVSRPQVHGYDLNSLVMIHHHKHNQLNQHNQSLVANIDNNMNNLNVNNTTDSANTAISNTNITNSTINTNTTTTSTQGGLPQYLVTVGDEKVVRVFTPPGIVIDGLATLCHIGSNNNNSSSSSNSSSVGQNSSSGSSSSNNETVKVDGKSTDSSFITASTAITSTTTPTASSIAPASTVYRAYIPELGLSNLASEFMSAQEQIEMNARNVTVMNWSNQQPPLESQLADYTIWPEYKKLYGHQNDVFCIAINHAQNMIVTASKAKDKYTAKILVWEVASSSSSSSGGSGDGFNCIDSLEYHESTVVAMRFSACDTYLASTGKDRSVFVYSQVKQRLVQLHAQSSKIKYELCTGQKNAHKRIIWDCSWVPSSNTVPESHSYHLIVTVSRDGCAKVWKITESMSSPNSTSDSSTSATTSSSATSSTTITNTAVVLFECVLTIASPFGVGVAVTSIDIHRNIFSNVNKSISSSSGNCLVLMGAENGCISLWQLVQHNQNPKHGSTSNNNNDDDDDDDDDDATTTGANAADAAVIGSDITNSSSEYEMVLVDSVSDYFNHGTTVKRVRWASNNNSYNNINKKEEKISSGSSSERCMFASCGEDNTVRIFRFDDDDVKQR